MTTRPVVDLNDHMNTNKILGGSADFDLIATPVMYRNSATGNIEEFGTRRVITRAPIPGAP